MKDGMQCNEQPRILEWIGAQSNKFLLGYNSLLLVKVHNHLEYLQCLDKLLQSHPVYFLLMIDSNDNLESCLSILLAGSGRLCKSGEPRLSQMVA